MAGKHRHFVRVVVSFFLGGVPDESKAAVVTKPTTLHEPSTEIGILKE